MKMDGYEGRKNEKTGFNGDSTRYLAGGRVAGLCLRTCMSQPVSVWMCGLETVSTAVLCWCKLSVFQPTQQ